MNAPTAEPATTALALLRVSLAHEYYGGAFANFSVSPLPSTTGICRRLGLRLVRDGADLLLCVTADAQDRMGTDELRAALAAVTLCWEIRPSAPEFAAFTDLDCVASESGPVLTTTSPEARSRLLTAGKLVGNDDIWLRQSLQFSWSSPQPLKAGAEVSVETNAGVRLSTVVIEDPRLVSIDLSAFGSGLYCLQQGTRTLAQWFADERGALAGTGATMLVLSGAVLRAAYANALGNLAADSELPTYAATFGARTAVWRYRIFNTQSLADPNIVAIEPVGAPTANATRRRRQGPPPFRPRVDPALPDAQSFEVGAFKLAAAPAQRFALRSGEETRYAPLPLAGLCFARTAGRAALFTEIFVYL